MNLDWILLWKEEKSKTVWGDLEKSEYPVNIPGYHGIAVNFFLCKNGVAAV